MSRTTHRMQIITKNLILNLDDISLMVLDPVTKSASVKFRDGYYVRLIGPALADLQQAIENHNPRPTFETSEMLRKAKEKERAISDALLQSTDGNPA